MPAISDSTEKFLERVVVLETNYINQQLIIAELKETYKEDMEEIKKSLGKIEEQTSRWKGVAGGIFIAMTFLTASLQWLLSTFDIHFKDIFAGIR